MNPLVVNGGSLKDYFTRDFWGTHLKSSKSHLSWRPLVTLLFHLEKLCAPSEYLLPTMHFVNLIIHLINVLLFYEITKSPFGSLIFGCHPMSTEAINALVGRADQLITTLTLVILKSQNVRNQLIFASISIFIKGIFHNFYLPVRMAMICARVAIGFLTLVKGKKKLVLYYLGWYF